MFQNEGKAENSFSNMPVSKQSTAIRYIVLVDFNNQFRPQSVVKSWVNANSLNGMNNKAFIYNQSSNNNQSQLRK